MVSPFDKNPFAHPDVHHLPMRKKTEGCASVTHLRGHPCGASTPALRRYRRHHHKARPSPIRISDCGFSAGRPSFGNPKTATDAQCDGDDDARVQTRGRRARRPHVVSHALGAHHNVGSLSKSTPGGELHAVLVACSELWRRNRTSPTRQSPSANGARVARSACGGALRGMPAK